MIPVTFAGIVADGTIDSDGNEWIVEAVDGWDSPTVRGDSIDRPFTDGAFVFDRYYGARPLTVKGSCVSATGLAGVLAAQQRLAGAVSLIRTDGTLTVGESPTKQLTVRRGPALRTDIAEHHLLFEVDLIAADPRKYDTVAQALSVGLATASGGLAWPLTWPLAWGTSTSGGVAAVNAGNVATLPTVRFDGPSVHPAITNVEQSRTVSLDLTLGAGDWVDIDFDARTVLLNGTASRYGNLQSAQWWDLPPGSSTIRYAVSSGGGAATLTFRPAWV